MIKYWKTMVFCSKIHKLKTRKDLFTIDTHAISPINFQVSIHNISESNFTRNNASPSPHHVEITSVFGGRVRAPSAFEPQQPPPGPTFCDSGMKKHKLLIHH